MDLDEVSSFREDVKSRLLINECDLVDECKKQPAFYEEVSDGLSGIKAAAKKAKAVLEFIRAELRRAVRSDPDKFGCNKLTETVVEDAVIVQDEYQAAVKKLREAEQLADSVQACVFAVEHRKSMIRDLVSLVQCDYYNSEMVIKGSNTGSGNSREEQIMNERRRRREANGGG